MGGDRAASSDILVAPRFVPFAGKTTPPALRPGTVDRRGLVDRLRAASATEVLVVAPAGYGKSTLAALWAAADPRPFGWVVIDEADRDPRVFLTCLAVALADAGAIDDLALAGLLTEPEPWPELLPRLVEAVATSPEPFVLVLDDVHRLDGPSATVVLATVASRVAPGSAIVLLTRDRLPFPTRRGEVAGTTLRLDTGDLAMERAEASALLAAAGVDMDGDALRALHEETEGWPAGLYLAALALRGSDDPAGAIEHFAGGDRLVTEYLTEEVLAAMPPDDVEFLLETSVLGRLSGPLCDAALGRHGSGATLERLERDNRFVIRLDHRGEWYRYHHLFGEMLRHTLLARAPGRACDIARRASTWFDEHGDPDAAVEHALQADHVLAASLVWRRAPLMVASDRLDTVGRWLELFTPEAIERTPALAVTAGWHRLSIGDTAPVHRYATALAAAADERLPDGTPVAAAAALLRALTAPAGLVAMRDDAARADASYAPDSPYRVVACFLEGSAAYLLGDLAGARDRIEAGIRLGRELVPVTYAQCLAQLARVEVAEGRAHEAERLVDEAMQVVDHHRLTQRPPIGAAFSIAALVHLRAGRTARGDAERAQGMRLLRRFGDLSPYQVTGVMLELADAAILAGDLTGARDLLDGADRRLARLADSGTLPATALDVRARLVAASAPDARLVDSLTPAELRVLAYLPTHLSFGEIGAEIFVSRNTVKSHAMAIYRKLAVTSRSAAVARAVQLGLLAPAPSTDPR